MTNPIIYLVGLCVGISECDSTVWAYGQPTIQMCLAEIEKRNRNQIKVKWYCAINFINEGQKDTPHD